METTIVYEGNIRAQGFGIRLRVESFGLMSCARRENGLRTVRFT